MGKLAGLITGGAGGIGSFIVDEFLSDGHRVVLYDIADPQYEFVNWENLVVVSGDLLNWSQLTATVEKHDVAVVLHLAALLMHGSDEPVLAAVKTNIEGTVNVLECCRPPWKSGRLKSKPAEMRRPTISTQPFRYRQGPPAARFYAGLRSGSEFT